MAWDSARQPLHVGARLDAGDPLRAAVGGRGATVEAHRGLEQRERATGGALVQVRRERPGDRVGADAFHHVDARGTQPLDAGAADPRRPGSSSAITTRATPASMSASVHGGVLPWWLHGSRVT